MKKLFIFVTFIFIIGNILAQTTVFSDDFSTNTSDTWTTSGQIGSSSFYVNRSGADWGARRYNNQLELTNDASTTTNVAGWVLAYTSTADFGSPYNKTLASNSDIVTWYFNMRQIRTDPAGFSSNSYGVAFILAGTSNTSNNTGSGYAVALGQSGGTDPIRLIKYSAGLASSTNLITSNTTGLTDFGTEYLSIKVTYNPSNNSWELFLRNDGTEFANPMTGTLTSQGSVVDNTYTSSENLDYMGAYWRGSTGANQTAFFDNITVTVAGVGIPTITVNPNNLSDFSYIVGSGPSSEKSFSLTGSNLTANLTVSIAADAHFEISSTSGGTFVNSLSYTPTSGSVSATVYVRMKAGLSSGTYSDETITCASTGATSRTVSCSGTVYETLPPEIIITGTLNKFTMEQGTPSESQSYTLYGENLTENISITPPSGYQLSQDNINWVSSLSLAPDFNRTIYVRLNGSNITCYNGNINHSSGDAEVNLAVNGIVFEPTPDNLFLLDNFYYDAGLTLKDARWNSHSGTGTNTITVQSDNLTYLDYPSVAGNCISITTNGEDVNRTFTTQTANSVYASFLVNITSATTTGDYFIHFGMNPFDTGRLYGRVHVKNTGTDTFDFGLSKTTDTAVFSGNNYSYETTYLLVLKYEIVDGTNNDIISLFINPDISGTETTPSISISPNSADITNIGSIAIRQGSASNAPVLKLDGIRVANSWENLFEISEQPPLPVVLTSFTAIIAGENCVNISWITESETGLDGYYIWRSTDNKFENAQIISSMIIANNSSGQHKYQFDDREVYDSATYHYWLQSIELGGFTNIYGPVSIYYSPMNDNPTPEVPFETALGPIYPNPFNPVVFIPYSLGETTDLNFYIYNSKGQLIRHFYVGTQDPGYYRLSWDGKDSKGIECGNGVYQIVMKTGKNVFSRKAAFFYHIRTVSILGKLSLSSINITAPV
jgi:hypothetical protein